MFSATLNHDASRKHRAAPNEPPLLPRKQGRSAPRRKAMGREQHRPVARDAEKTNSTEPTGDNNDVKVRTRNALALASA